MLTFTSADHHENCCLDCLDFVYLVAQSEHTQETLDAFSAPIGDEFIDTPLGQAELRFLLDTWDDHSLDLLALATGGE